MGTDRPLEIQGGTLTGIGSILGNLTLGIEGNPPPTTSVTIKPGIDGAPGTISVSQQFQIFSPSAVTHIVIDKSGNYSKIVVDGAYAALAGTLVVERHIDYTPGLGTTLAIITSGSPPGSLKILGDFSEKQFMNNAWTVPGLPAGKQLKFVAGPLYWPPRDYPSQYGIWVEEESGIPP